MTIYTLRSFASSGRIIAVQRFSAESDKEALSIARDMVKGASAVARFDVWQGERRIEGKGAREEKKASPVRASPALQDSLSVELKLAKERFDSGEHSARIRSSPLKEPANHNELLHETGIDHRGARKESALLTQVERSNPGPRHLPHDLADYPGEGGLLSVFRALLHCNRAPRRGIAQPFNNGLMEKSSDSKKSHAEAGLVASLPLLSTHAETSGSLWHVGRKVERALLGTAALAHPSGLQ